MKQINKYIKGIAGISLLAAMLFSCAKFDEFSSKDATTSAPTVTVAVSNVLDSTVTVTASSNMSGYMSVYVMLGSDTNIYNRADLLSNNIPTSNVVAFTYGDVAANEEVNINFVALTQNSSYKILAVANNEEGNTSNVAETAFTTDDTYGPGLLATNPAISFDYVAPADGPIQLAFDEPVVIDATKKFYFSTLWDDYYFGPIDSVVTTDVTAAGNIVTVGYGTFAPRGGEYIFLSWEAGAVKDLSGNDVDEQLSYYFVDGGLNVAGLYWGVEARGVDAVSVLPATLTAATTEITVEFDDYVDGVDDGIELTFERPGKIETHLILGDDVSISGNSITITIPEAPLVGDVVTLSIPAETVVVIWDNPSVDISHEWTVE